MRAGEFRDRLLLDCIARPALARKESSRTSWVAREFSWRCEWDGEPATWPDYVRKVRLQFEKTRRRRRKYLGPELVSPLTGRAWTVTQEVEHDRLLRPDGAKYLILSLSLAG